MEEAARRLWDLCEEYNKLQDMRDRDSSFNRRMTCIMRGMRSYMENFCKKKHTVRKYTTCSETASTVNVSEEEEQTMEEWMLSVRDTKHMIAAKAEIQGLDGVALVEKHGSD